MIAEPEEENDNAVALDNMYEKKTISEKKYLTREETAELAGVRRGMVSKWYREGEFPVNIMLTSHGGDVGPHLGLLRYK